MHVALECLNCPMFYGWLKFSELARFDLRTHVLENPSRRGLFCIGNVAKCATFLIERMIRILL